MKKVMSVTTTICRPAVVKPVRYQKNACYEYDPSIPDNEAAKKLDPPMKDKDC